MSEYQDASRSLAEDQITDAVVRFSLPYCLYLDDCSFTVVLDTKPAYVSLVMATNDAIRGFPEGVKVPAQSRLRFDRWGRQAFTTVALSFPRHSWPEGYRPTMMTGEDLVNHSLQYINKLIDTYRHVGNEVLCDDIAQVDVIHYELTLLDRNSKIYNRSNHFFPFGNALISGEKWFKLSTDKQDYINGVTSGGAVFAIDDELVLSSEASFRKGQYRLAVLFNAQSFEVFCRSLIRMGYTQQGVKTPQEIELLLEGSFGNLARDHIRIACGFEFGVTSEFSEWTKKVRPIRNALAHGDRMTIDGATAVELINTIEAAKALLRQNLAPALFVPIL